MKKVFVFITLLVISFFLAKIYIYKSDNKEIVAISKQEKEITYVDIYLSGRINYQGSLRVPSEWTLAQVFKYYELKADADISVFDLKEQVYDGMIIEVKSKEEVKESNLININTASIEELMSLEGIGEVLAKKIIEYREQTSFKQKEDLKNVAGIKQEKYEKIKDKITVQ